MSEMREVDDRIRDGLDELARRLEPERSGTEALSEVRDRMGRRVARRHAGRRMLAAAAALVIVGGLAAVWTQQAGDPDVVTGDPAQSPEEDPSGPPTTEATSRLGTTTTTDEPSTQTSTTATTVDDTPADLGGGPGPGSDDGPPVGSQRPGPATTGPTNPSALVPKTPEQIEAMMVDGAVIQNVAITGGNVDVTADDVTFRNFTLDGGGGPYGLRSCGADSDCGNPGDQPTGLRVEDGEITNTSSAAFWGTDVTIRRLEIHENGGDALKVFGKVTIESSWWHHLGKGEGSANGVQFAGGGSEAVVRGNFCDMPVSLGAPYGSSACIIVSTDQALSASFAGNWLDGGNFTVQCGEEVGVELVDNRFGRDHRYGAAARCPKASGNVWDDTGQPI